MISSFFKNKKVILFYGSKGWIGSLFLDYLKLNHHTLTIIEGTSRIENEDDVNAEIKKHKPKFVVSFTGRTHGIINNEKVNTIDYLEYSGKLVENIKDNLFGPVILANICKKHKIHYTYLGTGCIFNNTKELLSFSEESKPNYFGSGYSVVKGFTDSLMKQLNVLNLRIRMPISSIKNERNFITKIANYKKICSIDNSMTVLDDFFPIFIDLILKKKTGTYNCTNPGTINHNDILYMYKEIVDPSFEWENISLYEQRQILKSDRSNNKLCTDKIKKEYPKLKNINESIKIILNKMILV